LSDRTDTSPPEIYCEAQSADSWEALASVLTPERIARKHSIGFTDPGRGPNYFPPINSTTAASPANCLRSCTMLTAIMASRC
jgi:hypothetical protein